MKEMMMTMMRMAVLRSHTILSTPDFLPQIGRWSNNGHGLVWPGMVWYCLVWYGMVWYASNNGRSTREGIAHPPAHHSRYN